MLSRVWHRPAGVSPLYRVRSRSRSSASSRSAICCFWLKSFADASSSGPNALRIPSLEREVGTSYGQSDQRPKRSSLSPRSPTLSWIQNVIGIDQPTGEEGLVRGQQHALERRKRDTRRRRREPVLGGGLEAESAVVVQNAPLEEQDGRAGGVGRLDRPRHQGTPHAATLILRRHAERAEHADVDQPLAGVDPAPRQADVPDGSERRRSTATYNAAAGGRAARSSQSAATVSSSNVAATTAWTSAASAGSSARTSMTMRVSVGAGSVLSASSSSARRSPPCVGGCQA